MNPSRLLIRADANPEIGFGHVMRCLALSQHWRDHLGPVTFVCNDNLPRSIASRLADEAMAVERLTCAAGSLDDAKQLLSIAELTRSDAIVIDGYQFGSAYQQAIFGNGPTTLVIDDCAHLCQYHADAILNQNPGAGPPLYENRIGETRLLMGSRYALIRREFLECPDDRCETRQTTAPQTRLLVTLGGFDPGPVTQTVIDAIEMLSRDDPLLVRLISPLDGLVIRDSRIDLVAFASNMAELYQWADVAVCAGGSTNWEMSLFGIPRVLVVLAENQRAIAETLQEAGCCLNTGSYQQLTANGLSEVINNLMADTGQRKSMQRANTQLVDGKGARRVAESIAAMCQRKGTRVN